MLDWDMDCLECVKRKVPSNLPRSLLTYVLFCVFGVGSWVAVNGLWAEISILTLTLPECSCLPAVLVVVIQVANLGPLAYTLTKLAFQKCGSSAAKLYGLEVSAVFLLVLVGTASCVCLAVFWDRQSVVGGEDHSVSLIVTSLFLALVDCTSSVVFVPFMKHFPSNYISALYIGEGLSGVLPSLVALSQGSVNGSIESCLRHYPGHDQLGLNFSPNVFFIFLAVLMLACGLAFLLINTLPVVRSLMLPLEPTSRREDSDVVAPLRRSPDGDREAEPRRQLEVQESDKTTTTLQPSSLKTVLRVLWRHSTIYVCLLVINFLTNGALSAISAFAFFPYGSDVYHIAINLALLATPLMSVLYLLLPHKSPVFTAVLSSLACLLGVYILVAAILSPPPLHSQLIGRIIIVCVNVGVSGLVGYAKVGAVVQLHANQTHRDTALLLAGLVTQVGSLLGAVLFFVLVYFTQVFPTHCS